MKYAFVMLPFTCISAFSVDIQNKTFHFFRSFFARYFSFASIFFCFLFWAFRSSAYSFCAFEKALKDFGMFPALLQKTYLPAGKKKKMAINYSFN